MRSVFIFICLLCVSVSSSLGHVGAEEPRRLPFAVNPLARMSIPEEEAWLNGRRADGSPNWPASWLAPMNSQFEALKRSGVVPADGTLRSPDDVTRLVAEFYRDWGDEHANAQWHGFMLVALEGSTCANDKTADALAESVLSLYSEGLASTGPAWAGMFANAIRRIDAPSFPELSQLADELYDEAIDQAAANGRPSQVEWLTKRRARSEELDPNHINSTAAVISPDEAERILRTAGETPIDNAVVDALLLELKSEVDSDDLRSTLRRLRAVTAVLQRSRREDARAQAALEAWLLALAESPRWSENRTLIRSWSRCIAALGRRVSEDFCKKASALADSREHRAWKAALRAVAVRCESRERLTAPGTGTDPLQNNVTRSR